MVYAVGFGVWGLGFGVWALAWLDHPRATAILNHFASAEPDQTILAELAHIRASFHSR